MGIYTTGIICEAIIFFVCYEMYDQTVFIYNQEIGEGGGDVLWPFPIHAMYKYLYTINWPNHKNMKLDS